MSIDKLVIKKVISALGRSAVCVHKVGDVAEISGEIDENQWCIEVSAERKKGTMLGVSFELYAQKFNEAGFMIKSVLIDSFESYDFSSLEHYVKKCVDALDNPSAYSCQSTLLPAKKCKNCANFSDGICEVCDISVDENFNCLLYKV